MGRLFKIGLKNETVFGGILSCLKYAAKNASTKRKH